MKLSLGVLILNSLTLLFINSEVTLITGQDKVPSVSNLRKENDNAGHYHHCDKERK
jgi:hypothetical protein